MPPPRLREKVEVAIQSFIDQTAWRRAKEIEGAETASMADFLKDWQSRLAARATP